MRRDRDSTPGTSRYNGFQDRRNRPLCHLSKLLFRSASFQNRCKGSYNLNIRKFFSNYFIRINTSGLPEKSYFCNVKIYPLIIYNIGE